MSLDQSPENEKLIYFASLNDQTRRREFIRRNLEGRASYGFVTCVDGRAWGPDEANQYLSDELKKVRLDSLKAGKSWLASGAVACFITHRDRLIANATSKGNIFCEDDVLFEADFLALLKDEKNRGKLSDLNGVLLLNYRSRSPIIADKIETIKIGRYSVHRVISTDVASAASYFMTKQVAESIRSAQTPLRYPMDAWAKYEEIGAIGGVYLVHPPPTKTGHFPSTINYNRGFSNRLLELVRHNALIRRARWLLLRAKGVTYTTVTKFIRI